MSGYLYIGIDPGLSGALAFYDPATGDLEVFDVPVHEVKVAKSTKKRLDMHGLADLVRERKSTIKAGIVESVSAMPGQGVSSMFAFGFVAGALQATVAANTIPLDLVTPTVWKKRMGLTKDKDACRRAASMLMPRHAGIWKLAKHDGRAEATLLAYYLAHEIKGVAK